MLKSAFYIFAFTLAGELLRAVTGLPVPGPVIGMALIFAALYLRLIRLECVKPAADLLTRNLGLFFVPPGVGLMMYGHTLRDEGLTIAVSAIASTLLVMACTGWIYQLLSRRHG